MSAEPVVTDEAITINGLRLHYRDWGGPSSQPALAFHGFALNAHSFDEVAPRLSDLLHVRAFDWPIDSAFERLSTAPSTLLSTVLPERGMVRPPLDGRRLYEGECDVGGVGGNGRSNHD